MFSHSAEQLNHRNLLCYKWPISVGCSLFCDYSAVSFLKSRDGLRMETLVNLGSTTCPFLKRLLN